MQEILFDPGLCFHCPIILELSALYVKVGLTLFYLTVNSECCGTCVFFLNILVPPTLAIYILSPAIVTG